MLIEFTIHLESEKPENARRALDKMVSETGTVFDNITVEKYFAEGCIAKCSKEMGGNTWEQIIYNTLEFSQIFGHGWSIISDISEGLEMTTKYIRSGSGITLAKLYLLRSSVNV